MSRLFRKVQKFYRERRIDNMIVYKCDKCKKEVEKYCNLTEVCMGELSIIKYQLCDNCAKKLIEFIEKSD